MELEATDFDLPKHHREHHNPCSGTGAAPRDTPRGHCRRTPRNGSRRRAQGEASPPEPSVECLEVHPGGRADRSAGKMFATATVEISVTDTGVGIAPEDQETGVRGFRQVGTASKKVEGTGLRRLAISRKFIELHGGKIWVKSHGRERLDLRLHACQKLKIGV